MSKNIMPPISRKLSESLPKYIIPITKEIIIFQRQKSTVNVISK